MAHALHREVGIDADWVNKVFLALRESYTTDADDVAVLYLRQVFAKRGNVLQTLRLNRSLRQTLIRVLDEGWTTREERYLISQLSMLY